MQKEKEEVEEAKKKWAATEVATEAFDTDARGLFMEALFNLHRHNNYDQRKTMLEFLGVMRFFGVEVDLESLAKEMAAQTTADEKNVDAFLAALHGAEKKGDPK